MPRWLWIDLVHIAISCTLAVLVGYLFWLVWPCDIAMIIGEALTVLVYWAIRLIRNWRKK